jgi:hypothetical protein
MRPLLLPSASMPVGWLYMIDQPIWGRVGRSTGNY